MSSVESGVSTQLDKQLWELTEIPSFKLPLIQALLQINSFANASELAGEISYDPALTARILRIANSPFFGMSREIATLQEAIVLMGSNRVRDLLIATCFSQVLSALPQSFDQQGFWRHSLIVADCARSLAGYCSISKEQAFAAGLLHDIGLAVLAILFPEKCSSASDNDLCEVGSAEFEYRRLVEERKIFEGNDHAKVGGRVAFLWNFPDEIKEAIEYHADRPRDNKSLALIVYLANLLSLQSEGELDEGCAEILTALSVPAEIAWSIKSKGHEFADLVAANI